MRSYEITYPVVETQGDPISCNPTFKEVCIISAQNIWPMKFR